MRRIGWSDLYARRLEIRRSYIAGDEARTAAQIEALTPMINFNYGHRHKLGCPRCVLAELAEYASAIDIDLLGELLRPVLEGTDDFPNENPAAVLGPDRLTCDAGRTAHVFYGRALLLAGATDALDPHIHVARESDLDECFLLPMIFLLEAAMVTGDAARIDERVKLLRPRVERHEDVDEAMVGAIRLAQALELLGEDEADQRALWAFAERCARRLDARLDAPRHLASVARARADGPTFVR